VHRSTRPRCTGAAAEVLRLIALMTEGVQIRRILDHIGVDSECHTGGKSRVRSGFEAFYWCAIHRLVWLNFFYVICDVNLIYWYSIF
jgi:hypothetical protein